MRSHSTKNQLKEKSPEAKFILSNTLQALLLFKIQKIQTSVSFCVRQLHSRVHSALGTFLAASPSCPELHTRAWSLPGVGGTLARPRRRLLRRRDLPWRPTGGTPRQNTVPRRPSLPGSPRGLMHASARSWHRHRGRQARDALPAADGPAPPRSVELAPSTKSQPD